MAVLAGAVHRAVHLGARLTQLTDVHLGIGHVGQAVHEGADGVNLTTARTEYHAVLVAVGADGAALDVDRGMTMTSFGIIWSAIAR